PEVMDKLERRLIQLKIEREAVKKEKDEASQKRLGLIEDEILLSMPLIPKHPDGTCQPHASSFGEGGDAGDPTEKPQNPFNILKNMKKN
ncbi:MAG: hypothetical protein RJA46_469, partial [Pseudomonadota bacterium]